MQVAVPASSSSIDDEPLRLLLVRSRPGELPWLAQVIAKTMAPVQIVEIIGFANAIWRLGNERFDTVLLDVEMRDPAAMAYYREQISDVAAVPVLDVREPNEAAQHEAAQYQAGQSAPKPNAPVPARDPEPPVRQEREGRKGLRVPWQRRPRRQPQEPLPVPEPTPAG